MLRAHFILVLIACLTPMALVLLFTISFAEGHLKYKYVFFGHLGMYPIESCIFSACFNISAAFHLLLCFLRYLQTLHKLKELRLPEKKKVKLQNGISTSLACGMLASLGLSIASSFQKRIVPTLHFVGLFFFCGFNFAYFLFQTYFTFVLTSKTISIYIKCARVGIVIVMFALQFYLPAFFCYLILKYAYFLKKYTPDVELKKQGDPLYRTGIIVEWILFFCCQGYYYTFYPEFKRIGLLFDRIVFIKTIKSKGDETTEETRRTLSISSQLEIEIFKQVQNSRATMV